MLPSILSVITTEINRYSGISVVVRFLGPNQFVSRPSDQPHACGGNRVRPLSQVPLFRPAPRVWGKRQKFPVEHLEAPTSPTRVGETLDPNRINHTLTPSMCTSSRPAPNALPGPIPLSNACENRLTFVTVSIPCKPTVYRMISSPSLSKLDFEYAVG